MLNNITPHMKYKIVKNKSFLKKGTQPVSTLEEGEEIAKKLVDALEQLDKTGLGLSANQIGINKSVAVTKVGDELTVFIISQQNINLKIQI